MESGLALIRILKSTIRINRTPVLSPIPALDSVRAAPYYGRSPLRPREAGSVSATGIVVVVLLLLGSTALHQLQPVVAIVIGISFATVASR